MNVQPVVIDPDLAAAKLQEYRNAPEQNRRVEDADFRRLYRAAAAGKPILDVASAFQQTGLSDKGHPRLALARANWDTVCWRASWMGFSDVARGNIRAHKSRLICPPVKGWGDVPDLRTVVPHIPPLVRPNDNLEKYHILFEVPDWQQYSADPFLLRRLAGWLFIVCGEWELTQLEVSLLKNL